MTTSSKQTVIVTAFGSLNNVLSQQETMIRIQNNLRGLWAPVPQDFTPTSVHGFAEEQMISN